MTTSATYRVIFPLATLLLGGAAVGQGFHDRRTVEFPSQITADNPQRTPALPRKQGFDGTLVLKGGRIFDSVKDAAYPGTLVIRQNKIVSVLPATSTDWPSEAVVMDVTGKTVMAGMIDMHVHVGYPLDETPADQMGSEGSGTLRALKSLQYALENGITSVRDQGSPRDVGVIVSEWLEKDMAPGPRVFTAAHIITGTGGHAADSGMFAQLTAEASRNKGGSGEHPTYIREAEGPDDWRKAVREMFKMGASHIKIASHFAPEEARAGIEEAHRLGLKVTCDCETIYIPMAIEAGVDTIEHPLPRSDAAITMMAKRGVGSIPTQAVYQNLFDTVGVYTDSTSRRFSMGTQENFNVLKKMIAAGVTIGVGTDTIANMGIRFTQYPTTYIAELKFLQKAGFTPAKALIAATRVNSQLLDMDDKLGTLEAGKLADVIVVDGQPDQNLDDLAKVETVIRNGNVVIREGRLFVPRHVPVPLPKPSPPDTLQ